MFSIYSSSNQSSNKFILDILDGMYDWVRVVDRDNCVIFMNRSMEEGLGTEIIVGKKCYELLGQTTPCENCITRRAVFEGKTYRKEEVFGDRVFSVMSSPIISDDGDVFYAVEVLRDVTKDKELEHKILVQNTKLQSDLAMAKKMQMQLLPKNVKLDTMDYAYLYHPCETLGGDFFHIFDIDDHHTGMYIADVSGHGVSASMLTIFLRSSIIKRSHVPSKTLKKLFRAFNESDLDKDLYITVFYGVYNSRKKTFTYSNAGHNCPPLLISGNNIKKLSLNGVPISNWVDEPEYIDITVPLNPDEKLFLYTDGVGNQWLDDPGWVSIDAGFSSILKDSSIDSQITLNLLERYTLEKIHQLGDKLRDDITMALVQPKK